MDTLIETEKSTLKLINLKNTNITETLMNDCVNDVKNSLNHYPEIICYGRVCVQKRDVGFFSNESIGYKYSGKISESKKMTNNLLQLLSKVNEYFGENYNGILINYYANGDDTIGAHSDDESTIDNKNCGVVSISYGSDRLFRIREKGTKKITKDINLTHLDMIQMAGLFQKEFTHEVPIQKKIITSRYSFTFRKHSV